MEPIPLRISDIVPKEPTPVDTLETRLNDKLSVGNPLNIINPLVAVKGVPTKPVYVLDGNNHIRAEWFLYEPADPNRLLLVRPFLFENNLDRITLLSLVAERTEPVSVVGRLDVEEVCWKNQEPIGKYVLKPSEVLYGNQIV